MGTDQHTESEGVAPLNNPSYVPRHPPQDGRVPDVVEKWGPRSQLRWFERYGSALRPQPLATWNRFHHNSPFHRGDCCISCIEDGEFFEDDNGQRLCCCLSFR